MSALLDDITEADADLAAVVDAAARGRYGMFERAVFRALDGLESKQKKAVATAAMCWISAKAAAVRNGHFERGEDIAVVLGRIAEMAAWAAHLSR